MWWILCYLSPSHKSIVISMLVFILLYEFNKPANLDPTLGSQALPVTSQDKVVSDRGVTPLFKKTLVQLARPVVPCKGPFSGYSEALTVHK